MNDRPESHPSFLELDRTALGMASAEATAHVEGCSACAAYLDRVRQRLPVPQWVGSLQPKPSERRPRWFSMGLVAALATTATVIIAVRVQSDHILPADHHAGSGVTAKGMPSIALYVKRGDHVSLWDGQSSLASGDSLRLKVTPEGFSFVSVIEQIGRAHV